MSAYLCSSDTLSALATYWHESIMRDRFGKPDAEITRAIYHGSPGMPWSDACIKGTQLTTGRDPALVVYELLLAENQASLEARYPGDLEYRSAEGYSYSPDPHARRAVLHNRTGWLVSLLDGYEYQSCEHDGWSQSIGQAICHQIRRCLTKDLERLQNPGEQQRFWASYDRSVWDAKAPAAGDSSTSVPV